MFAVIIAKWVADALGGEGIYDATIKLYNYPYLDPKSSFRFTESAQDIAHNIDYVLEEDHNTIESLEKYLSGNQCSGFPIVTNSQEMIVVGYIARDDLKRALDKAKVVSGVNNHQLCTFTKGINGAFDMRLFVDQSPICFDSQTSLNIIEEMFKKNGLRYCLLVSRGVLTGIITKKDILVHIASLRRPENPIFSGARFERVMTRNLN